MIVNFIRIWIFLIIFSNFFAVYIFRDIDIILETLFLSFIGIYMCMLILFEHLTITFDKSTVAFLIFYAFVFRSMIISLKTIGISQTLLAFRTGYLYVLLGFAIGNYLATREKVIIEKIESFLILITIISLMIGIKQVFYIDSYERTYLSKLGFVFFRGYLRPIGTYPDTPHYAAMSLLLFQLSFYRYIRSGKRRYLYGTVISFISTILSLSRSRFISLIITISVLLIYDKSKKALKLLLAFLVAIVILIVVIGFTVRYYFDIIMSRFTFESLLGVNDFGVLNRLTIWKKIWDERTLFGYGLGFSTFNINSHSKYYIPADNAYFKILHELGIVGLISYLFLISVILFSFLKAKEILGLVILMGVLITSITGYPLDAFPYNVIVSSILGILYHKTRYKLLGRGV